MVAFQVGFPASMSDASTCSATSANSPRRTKIRNRPMSGSPDGRAAPRTTKSMFPSHHKGNSPSERARHQPSRLRMELQCAGLRLLTEAHTKPAFVPRYDHNDSETGASRYQDPPSLFPPPPGQIPSYSPPPGLTSPRQRNLPEAALPFASRNCSLQADNELINFGSPLQCPEMWSTPGHWTQALALDYSPTSPESSWSQTWSF